MAFDPSRGRVLSPDENAHKARLMVQWLRTRKPGDDPPDVLMGPKRKQTVMALEKAVP